MTLTLKRLDGGTRSLTSADLDALDIALDGSFAAPATPASTRRAPSGTG